MGSSSLGRSGDYPSIAPCYALASSSLFAAASASRAGTLPSPRNPRRRGRSGLQRRQRLRAPRPAWLRGRRELTAQPSPRPPSNAPRRCPPAAALLYALGLSSPELRAAPQEGGRRAGAEPGPRVLTPPAAGGAEPGLPREAAPGGCVRPRADPVPQSATPPALARHPPSPPRSQRPPPAAPAACARPPPSPPPAPPRLSSTPRCVPIPAPTSAVAAPTSQVTKADKPGRALHGTPGCPLPATHTRRPLGHGAYRQGGAVREHPRQARQDKVAGWLTSTQPSSLRQAPRSPSARSTCTRHALRARALRTHLPANCGMRPDPRGRWRSTANGRLEFLSVKARLGRGCALPDGVQALLPYILSHARLPVKGSLDPTGRAI